MLAPGAMPPIRRDSSRASFTRLAVDRDDHVAGLDAGLDRGAVLLRLGDQRALVVLEVEAVGDLLGHRLDLHADPAARDRALVLELGDHGLHRLRRNREGDADRAAGRRIDRGVDADHAAVGVEGRATGVALVDRRVDLEEVVVGTRADVAAARRHDAGGHGAAETERIADREHPVADPRRLVGEPHVREVAAVDLDQREVGARIGADHLGRIGLAVVERDLDGRGVLDDVVVGHGIAVGRDQEARALAADEAAAARRVGLPGMPSGMPKRRKNCSIGEPLGNGSSRSDESCGPASDLTRTEITAGFTFSTMSAKPIGCASGLRLLRQVLRQRGRRVERHARRDEIRAGAQPGDVVARRARRRAERPPFWL